jgi:hypothetical protein
LAGQTEKDIVFILDFFFKEGIPKYLDIIHMTFKSRDVLENSFEYCGFKQVVEDSRIFCTTDKNRCKWNQLLTNVWWKQPVIYAEMVRIALNSFKIVWTTRKRDEREAAAEDVSYKLYDVGDDFGSILRFSLDYRVPQTFDHGDWD